MIKELALFIGVGALAGGLAAVEVGAGWWSVLLAAAGALLGAVVWLEFSKQE